MPNHKSIYEPREDSTMLEKYVRQYAKGNVLDMGTGSGIQAIAAAQSPKVKSVLATDIQKGVVEYCKKNIKSKTRENQRFSGHKKSKGFFSEIKFLQSDLFGNVKGKFDTIVFNPPYLPQELKLKDLTIEGGKKGYEVIEEFLSQVNGFLKPNGTILMVFSSLTKKEKVEEFIKNNLLDFEELEKAHIFFEDIYVYLLKKGEFLKKLENKGISNVEYLTKGHRGLLFTGIYRDKKVAIKAKNPQSRAVGRIENEAKWLKKLNRYGIGPRLIFAGRDFFVYEFIKGDFIVSFIKKSDKSKIKKIIKNIFNQMHMLDNLKIDKEEMHHPFRHIIISKDKPYMVDFERTHYAKSPKNVTQFCQFLISGYLSSILKSKKITISRQKMIRLAKVYKSNQNIKNIKKIMSSI